MAVTEERAAMLRSKVPKLTKAFQWIKTVLVKSKAAIIILAVNAVISTVFAMLLALAILLPNAGDKVNHSGTVVLIVNALYALLAFSLLLYPLGGCLADVCCGRYRVLTVSLVLFWFGIVLTCVSIKLTAIPYKSPAFYAFWFVVIFLLFVVGFSGFQSNVVQFGLDQLQEASSEELSIFLHWFVWTDALGRLCIKTLVTYGVCSYPRTYPVIVYGPELTLIILTALMCLTYNKRQAWFYMERGAFNPYKMVFRVLKFVRRNKRPLQRSAFTYTGDETPSRIDYAKTKYGGPFTTEEVEDVKTFLRILGLLLCIGPIFTAEVGTDYLFTVFGIHVGNNYTELRCTESWLLLETGSLSNLVTVAVLPVYMAVLKPYRRKILHRLGVGIAVSVIGLISMLLIDAIGHKTSGTIQCMFTVTIDPPSPNLRLPTYLLLIPNVLSGVGLPVVSITVLEFISAQSPHRMKGLLVGIFYAIKGLYQLLGEITLVPFILPYRHTNGSSVSCGTGYYLVVTIIAVGGLLLYVLAASRYKYRQRGEQPYNQMHVEEYYEREVAAETNQESPS